jgi:hypothetical protein
MTNVDNKIFIGALAEDLYRVANGLHSGAYKMAGVFIIESLKRSEEVNRESVKPYIKKCLEKLPEILNYPKGLAPVSTGAAQVQDDKEWVAENALMYSVIFRNYAQTL